MSWRHNESSSRGFKNIFLILSIAYCLPLPSAVNLRMSIKTPRKLSSFVNDGICFRLNSLTTLGWTMYLAFQSLFYSINSLSQSGQAHPSYQTRAQTWVSAIQGKQFGRKTPVFPAGSEKGSMLL